MDSTFKGVFFATAIPMTTNEAVDFRTLSGFRWTRNRDEVHA